MKIRFAVLAALVVASAVGCAKSPTASAPTRRDTTPSTYNADGSDTTSRSGVLGSGH